MKEKDKISRKAFQEPGIHFLTRLLGMDVVKMRVAPLHVRQTIFERETDIVLLIETRDGREFILHLEFQSKNDSKMVFRMAVYDNLLHEEHRKEVLGIVIYIGKAKLRMKNKIQSFGNNYSCPIIDIRDIDPQVFISSHHPRQVIFGILAGREDSSRALIIQQILSKLQVLAKGSDIELTEYIIEMEYLAQGRSLAVQEQIKKEVNKMPITFPIENSLYFRDVMKMAARRSKEAKLEGKLEGKQEGLEEKSTAVVKNLLLKGKLTMQEIAEAAEVSLAFVRSVKQGLR